MPDCNGNNPPPRWSLEELALAYELRQEGCSWKRIAQGLGRDLGDDRLLSAAVSHLVQHGIRKGRDGYARQPGRPATFSLDLLRAADRLRSNGLKWKATAAYLDVDAQGLRTAHQYAKAKGLLTA